MKPNEPASAHSSPLAGEVRWGGEEWDDNAAPLPDPPRKGEGTTGTIAQLLQSARAALIPVAGELAGLEARLLAAHAWDMPPETLLREAQSVPAPEKIAALDALLQRRARAEPIAQIVGYKDFWKDRFLVTGDVLTPRADSETVIEAVLKLRPDVSRPCRILDIGAGSGCLLLSLLREYENAQGVGVDISPAALAVLQRNARQLGLASRAQSVQSDLCQALDASAKFDIVVSNPPYIPSGQIASLMADVRAHEPRLALDGGHDGLDFYRRILAQLGDYLAKDALFVCEVGSDQTPDVVRIAQQTNLKAELVAKDLSGTERAVAFQNITD